MDQVYQSNSLNPLKSEPYEPVFHDSNFASGLFLYIYIYIRVCVCVCVCVRVQIVLKPSQSMILWAKMSGHWIM